MKRITVILDGSADRANAALGGKTPLEFADTPNLDALAQRAFSGLTKNIPDGLEVGSAVANMGLLGFDPRTYRGRSALEAAGCGIPTAPENMYIRMNLVHLEGENYDAAVMADYSARDIPTKEAKPIIEALSPLFKAPMRLRHMESFRSTLEIEGGAARYPLDLAPAHDIIGEPISKHQPNPMAKDIYAIQRRAFELLSGLGTYANGVWFWGDSVPPAFERAEGNRCCFSETVLMRGISAISGLRNFPTDDGLPFEDFLRAKAEGALEALRTYDRAYLHIQATDDLSHDRAPLKKAEAISLIDSAFIGPLISNIEGPFALLALSDHFTFSDTGAHGAAPVPFILYRSDEESPRPGARFTEASCAETGFLTTARELTAMMEGLK